MSSKTGDRLKALREKFGYSQSEIAALINVNRTTYIGYESGRSRPVRKLKELTQLYGVSADYILGVDDEPGTPDLPRKPKDLIEILEKEEYTLNGRLVDQEDREKMKRIIEALYWDAKEKNKKNNRNNTNDEEEDEVVLIQPMQQQMGRG